MLNNDYHRSSYVLIFSLLLSSCASGQQIYPLATPTSTPGSTDTLQPLQSTISPVVEITPTTSMELAENQEWKDLVFAPCLAISPEPPGGNEIPWDILILRGMIPYAMDPYTGERTEPLLPDPDPNNPVANDFSTSPDGKWLAYELSAEDNVSLVVEPASNILTKSSQGRILWRPNQPFHLEGWLSNENIMLVMNQSLENFGSTLIYNPFTGSQLEFSLEEMPNSLNQQYGMSGSYLMDHGNLIPDPTLLRVVYPLALEAQAFRLALWDVTNKKVLARFRYTLAQLSRDPLWSQDSRDFLIAGLTEEDSIEWFQVTRNGAVHQLTHFGEFLKDAEFNFPSRSWDGRYLTFQLIYNSRRESKYLFLDLTSQPPDGFCLNPGGEGSGSLNSPVWSPDSRYVVITHGAYSENSSDVILLDVEKREAFYIGNDLPAQIYGTGWMVKP